MNRAVGWIGLFILIAVVVYLLYNQITLQRDNNLLRSQISSMFNDCTTYSSSNPSGSRDISGSQICTERGAGKCLFTLRYQNLNEALNGNVAGAGSNIGLVDSCATSGRDDSTVAYCCR